MHISCYYFLLRPSCSVSRECRCERAFKNKVPIVVETLKASIVTELLRCHLTQFGKGQLSEILRSQQRLTVVLAFNRSGSGSSWLLQPLYFYWRYTSWTGFFCSFFWKMSSIVTVPNLPRLKSNSEINDNKTQIFSRFSESTLDHVFSIGRLWCIAKRPEIYLFLNLFGYNEGNHNSPNPVIVITEFFLWLKMIKNVKSLMTSWRKNLYGWINSYNIWHAGL